MIVLVTLISVNNAGICQDNCKEMNNNVRLCLAKCRNVRYFSGPDRTPGDMTRDELKTILARAYKEFYFRPGYILQTLGHLNNRDEWNRVYRSLKSLMKTIKLHK